jgi:hypothetical protein
MADYTQNPQGGFAPNAHDDYVVARSSSVSKFANFTGAAVSLALVVGVGVWGYKLLVRDVSGIPVVRAVAGEMRVRPQEPGGDFAEHQGLSVNRIAALGDAEERVEELRLAPQPTVLDAEDLPMAEVEDVELTLDEEAAPAAQAPAAQDIAAALDNGTVDALVAQLTSGVAPMDALDAETAPVLASVVTEELGEVMDAQGIRVSLRPSLRPGRSTAAAPTSASTSKAPPEISADSLPAGTRLVQLGAFDTPEIARAQWGQLNSRFGPFMEGKKRVVMEAKSGGRTFYRLRAEGFADIGDARRFCSALVAESVDCIPVVTR